MKIQKQKDHKQNGKNPQQHKCCVFHLILSDGVFSYVDECIV